jgi:uncharacterized lipoprotein YajG
MALALMLELNLSAQSVSIGKVTNSIKIGPLAGNKALVFGVENTLRQILQYEGYTVVEDSETKVNVEFFYFDLKKTSTQLAVFGSTKEEYQITARGYLVKNGKTKKKTTVTEYATNKSKSTIIIDKGGKFSDAALDSAVKKVCFEIIKQLKL